MSTLAIFTQRCCIIAAVVVRQFSPLFVHSEPSNSMKTNQCVIHTASAADLQEAWRYMSLWVQCVGFFRGISPGVLLLKLQSLTIYLLYLLKLSLWPDSRIRYRSAVSKSTVCGSTQWLYFEKNSPLSDQHNQSELRGGVWEVSIILVHMLWAAPVPCAVHTGLCSSPSPVQSLLLPGQILSSSSPNCKQWWKSNRAEKCPTIAHIKNKKQDKQCKHKELDWLREKTRLNIRASFQRWR